MNLSTRDLTLDASRADKKQRRIPAVISTEFPVDRGSYREVLLHGSDNVDLSRAPLPLIESHDGQRLNIGLVENLRLSKGKLRGDIVFGSSARANELWPDVEAGIIRHISIGYRIQQFRERGDTFEATRWMPFETSLVSIPADPNAGTYRSFPMQDNNTPSPGDTGDRPSRSQRRAQGADRALEVAERERAQDILDIAHAYRKYELDNLARTAVAEGWSVDRFRDAAMEKLTTRPSPVGDVRNLDRTNTRRDFSLVRAVGSLVDPRSVDGGYEREVSQELSRQLGRKPEGIFMPIGNLSRVLSASGEPELIGTQHMGSEFIDLLRARSFVMQLGPRVLSGLTQDVRIPRLTGSAVAGWIAADGADGLTPSDPTLDAVTLTPKTVGALSVFSRKMMLQGDPDAEQLLRNDFAKLIAVELDRAAIAGLGASNQPRGVINTTGITTGTFPLASGPSFATMLAMEAALMADSADQGSLAFLTTPALSSDLKGKEKATGSGQFIWNSGRERGTGEVIGLPAYASSNVPIDKIILGNWEDLLMGLWGAIDVAVDPNFDFAKGNVGVRILASVDFAVRHPKSFAVWSRATS